LDPPATGEREIKQVNKRTYYWCPKHKMWTAHKPEDCNKDSSVKGKMKSKNTAASNKMRITKALAAILEEQE
jgi:hypothetical protein